MDRLQASSPHRPLVLGSSALDVVVYCGGVQPFETVTVNQHCRGLKTKGGSVFLAEKKFGEDVRTN